MKQSAGALLYRQGSEDLEVVLVHASGAYNRNSPWSIPKGEPAKDETDLEAVARRETTEETDLVPGALVALGHADYRKSRKRVHCFAGPAPEGAAPRPVSWEVDRAEFLALEKARLLLHADQSVFLDRLVEHLKQATGTRRQESENRDPK